MNISPRAGTDFYFSYRMLNKKIVIPTIFAVILITLLIVFGISPKPTYKNTYPYEANRSELAR